MANDNTILYIGLAIGGYLLYQRMQPSTAGVAVISPAPMPAPMPAPTGSGGANPGVSLGNDLLRHRPIYGKPTGILTPRTEMQMISLPRGQSPPPAPDGYAWVPGASLNSMSAYIVWKLISNADSGVVESVTVT